MRVFVKLFVICLINLIVPLSVFAQSISVTKNPPYPREGESVLVSLTGHGLNLQNFLISWKQGKDILSQGVGMTSYTVRSATNQHMTVEITDPATGQKFTQGISVSTSEVDLLWEAVGSYTPPFYKGKALPAFEANINVVAIPKHKDINSLNYTWEKEYSRQAAQSGRGKNSFSYIANPLEQANAISVGVTSSNNSFQARDTMTIRYGNSEVLFYKDDSELGTLFNKAISNGYSVGDTGEISLTAIPFFITAESIASSALEMIWSVNDVALPVQTVKNKIRLSSIQSGIRGNVLTSIFIKNKTRLFEEGKVGVSLEF